MRTLEQINFSGVFFDSIFGLILFFGMDSFLEIRGFPEFTLYLFSVFVLAHWWLLFKSADDAFGKDVQDSALDLIFGIVYVVLIEFVVLYSKMFNYWHVTAMIIALIAIDLTWAMVWRYIGEWETKDKAAIAAMEKELDNTIFTDVIGLALLLTLLIVFSFVSSGTYVSLLILGYLVYVFFTFQRKIIDIRVY